MAMAEVLLVDDDGSVLLTLAIALRRQGHVVTVAGDALQAMTHLRKVRFDFLISDVRMPGISGLELAARARLLANPPRIILTSAYPFVEDRHSVSEAFLQKPIDVHLLSAYLNSKRPGPDTPIADLSDEISTGEMNADQLARDEPAPEAFTEEQTPAAERVRGQLTRSTKSPFLPRIARAGA
jgi:CheY-like chemotaxis protein